MVKRRQAEVGMMSLAEARELQRGPCWSGRESTALLMSLGRSSRGLRLRAICSRRRISEREAVAPGPSAPAMVRGADVQDA